MRTMKCVALCILCMSVICGIGYLMLRLLCSWMGLHSLPDFVLYTTGHLLKEHYLFAIVSSGTILGLLCLGHSDKFDEEKT